ncbi:hypothetical protein BT67DRAFT_440566 [Trichocladium antarcticum]|uniref:Uncharacterized protein n=1 Tax=Trichocladium antarcticum TaxID=1450529 RepID=A0AAN6ZFL4_9PEZI|nr:hypothetical protein BT67DRAFT_440566 [Trichocladium antarcticum]
MARRSWRLCVEMARWCNLRSHPDPHMYIHAPSSLGRLLCGGMDGQDANRRAAFVAPRKHRFSRPGPQAMPIPCMANPSLPLPPPVSAGKTRFTPSCHTNAMNIFTRRGSRPGRRRAQVWLAMSKTRRPG